MWVHGNGMRPFTPQDVPHLKDGAVIQGFDEPFVKRFAGTFGSPDVSSQEMRCWCSKTMLRCFMPYSCMGKEDSMVLEIAGHIEELAAELNALRSKDFPENESDLFLAKCVHLSEVLLVDFPFQKKGRTFLQSALFLRQNFSQVLNWLLGLKYRYLLLARVSKKTGKSWRKKLELSVPSFFRWEMEEE